MPSAIWRRRISSVQVSPASGSPAKPAPMPRVTAANMAAKSSPIPASSARTALARVIASCASPTIRSAAETSARAVSTTWTSPVRSPNSAAVRAIRAARDQSSPVQTAAAIPVSRSPASPHRSSGAVEQYRKRGEQPRPRLGHVLVDGLDPAERHSRCRRCQRVAPRHLRGEPDQPATGDDVHPVDPVPHQPADGERQFLGRPPRCTRIEGLLERCIDRGPVVVEPVEPGDLPGPAVAGRCRHPVDHPSGAGPDHRLLLTGLAQHAPRVCADGVELAEPGRTTGP